MKQNNKTMKIDLVVKIKGKKKKGDRKIECYLERQAVSWLSFLHGPEGDKSVRTVFGDLYLRNKAPKLGISGGKK